MSDALTLTGAGVTALLGLLAVLGLLVRLLVAVVRHMDAMKANTQAVADLAKSLADHVTSTDRRLTALEVQRTTTTTTVHRSPLPV